MEYVTEFNTTAVKRSSVDETEQEAEQNKPKSKPKKNYKRQVKRGVRNGRKQQAAVFNFAPAIDFGAISVAGAEEGATAVHDDPEVMDTTTADPAKEIKVPTWCPWCGFNCEEPVLHNKNYKQHERWDGCGFIHTGIYGYL